MDSNMGALKVALREQSLNGREIRLEKDQQEIMEILLQKSGWVRKDKILKLFPSDRIRLVLTENTETESGDEALSALVEKDFILYCNINGNSWYKVR